MIDTATVLPVLQMILAFCNIIIIGYGGYKFLNKPHDTLEQQVKDLEKRVTEHDYAFKEIKDALIRGNKRFDDQDEAIKILIKSTLALIDFEMSYCLIEHKEMSSGLVKVKEELNDYLSSN